MTLSEMIDECIADSEKWFDSPDLVHHALGMCGEAGEVANIVKKIDRGDFNLAETGSELKKEVADTFIYLLNIAGIIGMDLEKEYRDKRAFNDVRFTHNGKKAKHG